MPRVAGEVLAYCTRCRTDRLHMVVSLNGERIAKVECMSCKGSHNYRAPASEAGKDKTAGRRNTLVKKAEGAERKDSSASQGRPEGKARPSEEWRTLLGTHAAEDSRPYRISDGFDQGEFISHPTFGDGVVTTVVGDRKIEVLFEEGTKLLAQRR